MTSRRSELLSNVFTATLVLCAVIITTLMVRQYFLSQGRSDSVSGHLDGWERLLADRKANIGSDNAKLKIVEFSDYQCPYCRTLEPNLEALVSRHQGKIAVIRYDFPLEKLHLHAYNAAIASKCAEQQGVYAPFEDELFKSDLATVNWERLARQAKVSDISEFSRCLTKPNASSLVDQDVKIGNSVGIKATPTLIVNGSIVYGMQTEADLEKIVSGKD